MLCDAIGIIFTGRVLPRTGAPKDDEEARKKITSIALAAEPHVLIDNVAAPLGCSAIDAALTGTTWSDRILGKSQMTGAVLLITVWFATGNNMVFVGDTPRRTLPMRLESDLEKPEERDGFHIPDLLAWVRNERGRLAVAALTILKGYLVAGKPVMKLKAWGSFEEWSRLVRHAVVWCGLPDPGATRPEFVEASDARAQQLRLLLSGWEQADPNGLGMTTEQAVNRATETGLDLLRQALAHIATPDTPVSPRSLGMKLHHFKGRVCGERRFVRAEETNRGVVWKVEKSGESAGRVAQPEPPEVSGTKDTKGTNSQLRTEKKDSSICTHAHIERAGNTPLSAFSPSAALPPSSSPTDSCIASQQLDCESLHTQPHLWVRRRNGSHCPACDKPMGHIGSGE
jgi:hypothetical protein